MQRTLNLPGKLALAAVVLGGWMAWGETPARAADYAAAVQSTPGLLVHYRFEESDQRIQDASSHGRAGALTGSTGRGVDSASAALGRGLRISGGHLMLPALGDQEALSIELWLKLNGMPAADLATLFAVPGWEPGFFHCNLRGNGAVELAIFGASSYTHTEPQRIEAGNWYHLVVVYDSGTGLQQLYVNGRLAAEGTVNPHPSLRLPAATVGAWVNGTPSRPLSADIDELAIYSTALSLADVRKHYQLGSGKVPRQVDFATQILPLLENNCFDCHGPDVQESQLRLDVRDWVLRGGESGEPALMAYDSERSHLIELVTSSNREMQMPPDGDRLSDEEVALLRDWIDNGAPWPDELAGHAPQEEVTTDHWSFQPVKKVAPPATDDPFVTSGNPIDAFIFAQLAEQGLRPSPAADRRTLIRRLYLDVHGLPPTMEEVQAFIDDDSPEAWPRLVDRVLQSPRYGERWASHWLDVVRYAETDGFEVNTPRANAWPYRDYVIKSLNEDKPFNQFVREQIAGDQLGVDSATGFLVAAPALLPGQIGRDEASMRQARADELHEVVVSVSSGVLGLTVGCARCHNHKFDPISQKDYYQLQAFFTGVHYGDRPIRQPEEVQLSSEGTTPATTVFGGTFSQPEPAHRLYRGDPMQRRERVVPDIPAVMGTLSLRVNSSDAERRLALAEWLGQADNPLTPRVIVNRLWQHHFGLGIVATPSDFGAMGFAPTHPELLDWLAATLVENGWSLKAMHRLILLSNTYQQANAPQADSLAKDANAEYLWRFPPRRLDMEPIRDSILAMSGALDLTMGGPGFSVFKPNDNYVRVYDAREEWGPAEWRRMIYVHRVRMAQDGVFGAFDCPDAGQPQPRRARSTTALQALNLLNSTFVHQQAERLVERARKQAGDDVSAQIRQMYLLTLARLPRDTELAAALETAQEFGPAAVARALFNCNEVLFLP